MCSLSLVPSAQDQNHSYALHSQAVETGVLAAPGASIATPEEIADYLTDGFWADFGQTPHAFDTSQSNQITVNITALDDDEQALARAAMDAWESVADIEFVEVTGSAQITFINDQPGAYSSYTSINGVTQSSTVNVSSDWVDYYGSGLDTYSLTTYIHEIGHSLGLGHSGNYNVSATYDNDATFANDSWQISIMSYFSQTDNALIDASYAFPITSMLADIIAVQNLYGPPDTSSATAGDTTYGAGQTVGGYLGAFLEILTSGRDPNNQLDGYDATFTIYDRSGIDTVDFSTDDSDQVIDLSSGGIWDVYGLIGNVIVAHDTILENFLAGTGDDDVSGNAANNMLDGGKGDDTLNGADGDDTLLGRQGQDSLVGGDGNDTLSGNGDNDTLLGGAGNDSLNGQSKNDLVDGGAGNDDIKGGGGLDTLLGGSGNDTLNGSSSKDSLEGGSGDDKLRGGIGNDTLKGDGGNDLLRGGDSSDLMYGGSGHDTLNGDSGNDTLDGGTGDDQLTGALGKDDFVFATNLGEDTITDFEDNNDELHLDDALWSGTMSAQEVVDSFGSTSGGNTVLDFGGGNVIVLQGVTDAQSLVDDIVIF